MNSHLTLVYIVRLQLIKYLEMLSYVVHFVSGADWSRVVLVT
jgi:hypothetical protein